MAWKANRESGEVWRSHPASGNGSCASGAPVGALCWISLALDSLLEPWGCVQWGTRALRCCRRHGRVQLSQPFPTALLDLPCPCAELAEPWHFFSMVASAFASPHVQRRDLLVLSCCHLLILSHLVFLFSCHRSPCCRTFPGRVWWCLQRCWECPQWWTLIFICRPSRKFLSPLIHSSLFVFFFPLNISHTNFSFHFPEVPAGSLNHNLQFLKTEGTFLHSHLAALGFVTYCLLFYFLTKSNVSLTWWPT